MTQAKSIKQCSISKCDKPYYAKSFCHRHYKNNRYKTNPQYRALVTASNKKYHEKLDPEKRKEWDKKYKEVHPERVRRVANRYATRWREENPEKAKERLAEWRAKNKDKIREYQHDWKASHRIYNLEQERKRQAKQIVRIKKEEIYNWESCICGICDSSIEGKYHIDHIIPISKGGLHEVSNLQLAHPFCNLSKKDKLTV